MASDVWGESRSVPIFSLLWRKSPSEELLRTGRRRRRVLSKVDRTAPAKPGGSVTPRVVLVGIGAGGRVPDNTRSLTSGQIKNNNIKNALRLTVLENIL